METATVTTTASVKAKKEKVWSASPHFALRALTRVDYLGPLAVKDLFGIEISLNDIPPLPDEQTLAAARDLNLCLCLEVRRRGKKGGPLSMRLIHQELENAVGGSTLLRDVSWYGKDKVLESFFLTPITRKICWKFFGKEIISKSNDLDYLDQTVVLADYIRNDFCGRIGWMPAACKQALGELEREHAGISQLLPKDYRIASKRLVDLQINRLFRPSVGEMLYYLALHAGENSEFTLLNSMNTWTNSLSSNNVPVWVGEFTSDGMRIIKRDVNDKHPSLGAVFSCDVALLTK